MNGNELRKLRRRDLIEILLEQTIRIEELEKELEKANQELADRKTSLKEVGSLAEASLILSDIFKAADETANVYMNNIHEYMKAEQKNNVKALRELKKKKLAEIDKECKKRLEQAEKEIEKLKGKKKEVKEKEVKEEKKSTTAKRKRR